MEEKVFSEEYILELLRERKYAQLKELLITLNPADIAPIFEELKANEVILFFRLLPKDLAAETFVEMEPEHQRALIADFTEYELKEVVDDLFLDDAVDLIEEMPANVVKRILKATDPQTRQMINNLLRYPDDSAGSIMTIEFVNLKKTMTVDEAIKKIRKTGVDKETIYTCYVTENNGKLIGLVTAKTLLLAKETDLIGDIMETNVIFVHTLEDKEIVANNFDKYDFMALPVVDDEQRLVGIVTFDDAIDVLQEEATEDMDKMAAIVPSDKPYTRTSVFDIVKSRIGWLILLMVSSTFTAIIIGGYEQKLAAEMALTGFIPMLMGTAGNAGGQSSVTIIRSMSLNEIEFSDTIMVLLKELAVSLLCGLILGIAGFVKLLVLDRVAVMVALVVSITLLITVVCAKLVGSVLPIAAKRVGFDPAVMASPLITTIVDALALLIYFKIATVLLGI